MNELPEKTIIQAICDGDHEQYRHLVERYHRGLIQHIFNIVHQQESAEDIAQEAFLKAFEKIHQYNPEYAFSTWLYKIADNLAYRQSKRLKHQLNIDDYQDMVPDGKPTAAVLADQSINKAVVQSAIGALPKDYQRVITMYYWDELDYETIAGIMERPIGTIRTWLHRAKEQLRKELYGRV